MLLLLGRTFVFGLHTENLKKTLKPKNLKILSNLGFLVHGEVTIIFVVFVCLSVCLCRVFLSRL